MNHSEDKDPTCVIKMLDDFRSNSSTSRRTILGGKSMFTFGLQPPLSKPTKLNFDDSLSHSQNESGPLKKMRLDQQTDESVNSSVDSSKVNESSVMGKKNNLSSLAIIITVVSIYGWVEGPINVMSI